MIDVYKGFLLVLRTRRNIILQTYSPKEEGGKGKEQTNQR